MRVEILHIPDCPNFVGAGARVRLSSGVDAMRFTPFRVRWSSGYRQIFRLQEEVPLGRELIRSV